jgi:hypothetical protein
MKLQDWLTHYNVSVPKFCIPHDFCEESIYTYLKGGIPRLGVAVKIVKATHGEVSFEDLGLAPEVIRKIRLKQKKINKKARAKRVPESKKHPIDNFKSLKQIAKDSKEHKKGDDMSAVIETSPSTLQELEECISKAMNRINTQKETDLCFYIPWKNGHLHHFAFGRLKKAEPTELLRMIREHILEKDNPSHVSSKPRPALMVKRVVDVKLKRSQINQLLTVLKSSGSEIQGADELISMLSPHQTLPQVQKLMLEMIREKDIDQGLWETYTKLVEEERGTLQQK